MHHTLEVRDLRYQYPDGHEALRGVSFYIAPEEKVALVGPNGAGKSTLALHLNGILRGQGEVYCAGVRLTPGNLAEIRRSVGLVFEDPDDQLFSLTVGDDVAYGLIYQGLQGSALSEKVDRALHEVGLQGYRDRLSHHLSAGEKKRVAIASVLAMDPEILVLDEPASGLDPRSRRGLIRLLKSMPQTLLLATHDLRLAAELTLRTLVLNRGRIVADGPTEQVLRDEALLEANDLESPWRPLETAWMDQAGPPASSPESC